VEEGDALRAECKEADAARAERKRLEHKLKILLIVEREERIEQFGEAVDLVRVMASYQGAHFC
jgi:hypothetical protein